MYASLGLPNPDLPFPSDASESSANNAINVALGFAYASFIFDFMGMLFGFTLFYPKINLFQIVTHFVGGVYVSWFIAESWHYESLMWIVGFTNITTMIVEIIMLFAIFVAKIVVF